VWVLENGHTSRRGGRHFGYRVRVGRNSPTSFEPQCGDAEADATVLAIYRSVPSSGSPARPRTRSRRRSTAGWPRTVPVAAASRLVYMVSSSQVLSDPTGKVRPRFMPHLMVYYPFMKNSAMGIVASKSMDVPGVVQEDTPMSALVVVMRDWVDPNKTP